MGENFDDSKTKIASYFVRKNSTIVFFYPSYFAFFNENRGREDYCKNIFAFYGIYLSVFISVRILQYWCCIRIYRNSTTVEKRSSTM